MLAATRRRQAARSHDEMGVSQGDGRDSSARRDLSAKTGFGVPLRQWMSKRCGRWSTKCSRNVRYRRAESSPPSAVRQLIDLDRQGSVDAAYPIFLLACIELWCRAYAS